MWYEFGYLRDQDSRISWSQVFKPAWTSLFERGGRCPVETAQRFIALAAFRGPGFDSQQPNISLQLPITPIPGDLMSSSDFHKDQAHVVNRCTCRQNIHKIQIKTNFKNKKVGRVSLVRWLSRSEHLPHSIITWVQVLRFSVVTYACNPQVPGAGGRLAAACWPAAWLQAHWETCLKEVRDRSGGLMASELCACTWAYTQIKAVVSFWTGALAQVLECLSRRQGTWGKMCSTSKPSLVARACGLSTEAIRKVTLKHKVKGQSEVCKTFQLSN